MTLPPAEQSHVSRQPQLEPWERRMRFRYAIYTAVSGFLLGYFMAHIVGQNVALIVSDARWYESISGR